MQKFCKFDKHIKMRKFFFYATDIYVCVFVSVHIGAYVDFFSFTLIPNLRIEDLSNAVIINNLFSLKLLALYQSYSKYINRNLTPNNKINDTLHLLV